MEAATPCGRVSAERCNASSAAGMAQRSAGCSACATYLRCARRRSEVASSLARRRFARISAMETMRATRPGARPPHQRRAGRAAPAHPVRGRRRRYWRRCAPGCGGRVAGSEPTAPAGPALLSRAVSAHHRRSARLPGPLAAEGHAVLAKPLRANQTLETFALASHQETLTSLKPSAPFLTYRRLCGAGRRLSAVGLQMLHVPELASQNYVRSGSSSSASSSLMTSCAPRGIE